MFYDTNSQGYFQLKTSLDVFSLRHEHIWTYSVLGDRICEMKRVTESGQQGIKTQDHFCCISILKLGEPITNRESNHKDHLLSVGLPLLSPSMISWGYWGPIFPSQSVSLSGIPNNAS